MRYPKNLVGLKFGKLTVVEKIDDIEVGIKSKRLETKYKTICECGNIHITGRTYLLSGDSTHCGCNRKEDFLNKKIGKGLVIRYLGKCSRGQYFTPKWQLLCDCGNVYEAFSIDLHAGKPKSCGCLIHQGKIPCGSTNKYYFSILKSSAKRRNLEFTITKDYIENILEQQNNKCIYTNLNINFENDTASLDRIDSSKGYIEGNVQWVHKNINFMKNTLLEDEFINFCCLVSDTTRFLQ